MKKIGISTVHTGYNYGTLLQAYSTKLILNSLGYDANILSVKGGLIKGRDVRILKLIKIVMKFLLHPIKGYNPFIAYFKAPSLNYSEDTKLLFSNFEDMYIKPRYYSWKELKKLGNSSDYFYFLCGSDQIWNSDTLYVDPQYYLRYAQYDKRIAWAPSFGRNHIAKYNVRKIAKYINDIKYLSIREDIGVELIKKYTGNTAELLIDPTLVVDKNIWQNEFDLKNRIIKDKYVFAYFLNEPSDEAKKFIIDLSIKLNSKIVAAPSKDNWFDGKAIFVDAGPIEFLNLVNNSNCICTDSFHGTAFSINFNKNFYVFKREYGKAADQSSRIESLLRLVNLEKRYNPQIISDCSFETANLVLEKERKKSINYLLNSFKGEMHE